MEVMKKEQASSEIKLQQLHGDGGPSTSSQEEMHGFLGGSRMGK